MTDPVEVERKWLIFVDSITSLVAYRGLDEQAKEDLKRISQEARILSQSARPRQ